MTEELVIDRAMVARAAVGLFAVLAIAAVSGVLLREPIEALASEFIGRFGWAGVFAGVLFCDASPLPLTHEPIVLLAVAQGLGTWKILAVAAAASVTSGPVGYLGGWLLSQTRVRTRIEARSPAMIRFLERWGATGVAIAAVLPVPFAAATWTAGLVGVPLLEVVLASLLRIPKTAFYLGLIVGGWAVGADKDPPEPPAPAVVEPATPPPPRDPRACVAATADVPAATEVLSIGEFAAIRATEDHTYGVSIGLGREPDGRCVGRLVHWNGDIEGHTVPLRDLVCDPDGGVRFRTEWEISPGIRDLPYTAFVHRFEGSIEAGTLVGAFSPAVPGAGPEPLRLSAEPDPEAPTDYPRFEAASSCINASLAALPALERDLLGIPSNSGGPEWSRLAFEILCEREYDGVGGLVAISGSTDPAVSGALEDTVRRAASWSLDYSDSDQLGRPLRDCLAKLPEGALPDEARARVDASLQR